MEMTESLQKVELDTPEEGKITVQWNEMKEY